MKSTVFLVLLISSCNLILSNPVNNIDSLVVSSTELPKEGENSSNVVNVNPKIYAMNIQTNISNRFATTLVTSKVRNLKKNPAETTFSVILPENAFISQFEMEIQGKVYKAYVKEKEEARKIYQEAVSSGQSAGHVELSARDSKTFTVSVNIEPESKTIFRLTYEELLQRYLGQYELVVNIHPGQTVDDLSVNVYINESRPITSIKTPSLRTGNEIGKNDDNLDPSADIELINATSAVIKFSPNVTQQKEFAHNLGGKKENGLSGQFIVQYDVERDPQGGEVLVRDGYFVHFFSPSELKPLKKHVVFVLDHSGSMSGTKIDQLIEAMRNILSQLSSSDVFNIVRFSEDVSIWNNSQNTFDKVDEGAANYGNLEPQLRESRLPQAVEGTKENIEKAKNVINDRSGMGLTNIIGGLEVGLFLTKRTQETFPNTYQPMIIFLTDGLPNVGLRDGDEIVKTVTNLNVGDNRAALFSLSFGIGADKQFLRKLSSRNLGFSRHIYEASDASLQLLDFYQKISSPLLSNVTFKYIDGVTEVTKTYFPILFNGSELVVTGRTNYLNGNVLQQVNGMCRSGPVEFKAPKIESVGPLERLWAYLTVKEILNKRETVENKTELTKKALDLALKYSFVTSISSLVVVKPNKTDAVNSKIVDDLDLETRTSPLQFSYPTSQRRLYSAVALSSPHMSPRSFGQSASMWRSPLSSPRMSPRMLAQPVSVGFHRPVYPSPVTTTYSPIPRWLSNIKNNNGNITTSQGSFKLGKSGDVTIEPDCPKTPMNTTGICTLLLDCPQVFPVLIDVNIYLQYFCPLHEYAGVCCPKRPI